MAILGGVESVISTKINWLASHGYKVVLVTYEQCSHPIVYSLHPDIKTIDIRTPFYSLSKYPLYLRYFMYLRMRVAFQTRLKTVIKEVHPEVVLTIANCMNVIKDIYKACKGSTLIIESHETYFSVMKEYIYGKRSFLRLVAKLYDRHNLKYLNRFDRMITLTQGDAKEWREHIFTPIEVIPNPLADYPFSLRKKYENTFFRIISAGRLEDVKGFDRLIKAFAIIEDKCPRWHIDIFGKGSCEGELRKLIASYHLDNRIKILPPTNNIYSEYLNSDFYVLSSQHEGLGMVLLEAMACGIPCVSFNCDYGPREIIIDRETGLLVENGNIEKLALAMLWMIDHQDERLKMGKRARDSVKRYQTNIIMEKWVNLYNNS